MLIGIDLDNTIAGYDDVFASAAVAMGLLPYGNAKNKTDVRNRLMERPDGEQDWMRVQGKVYGARMNEAVLIDGVSDFFLACKKRDLPVCIVSHKSRFGHFDKDRINLRDAALAWMQEQGFFDPHGFALKRDSIYFESTRQAKVMRIAALGCTHFVDDLIEVFLESDFPEKTRPYLFAPNSGSPPSKFVSSYTSWADISEQILGASNLDD